MYRATALLPRALWTGAFHFAIAVGILAIWAAFASNLFAKTTDDAGEPPSMIGSYLSGRFARADQEPATAASFYEMGLKNESSD
ncbi:MAG: hypothetical protein ACRETL_09220, partial [Gammaproteobacteria bacterium]